MSDDSNLSSLWDDLLKDHDAETPLGEVVNFRGYVTAEQLDESLQEQELLQEKGTPRPIGEILFSKGHLTRAQFAEVLRIKKFRVHYCQPCHEIYDSSRHNSRVTVRCRKCGEDAQSIGDSDLPVSKMDEAILSGGELPGGAELGKYRLLRKIGEGGMGVIYEAEDPELGRTVALKVFKGGASNKTGISRLHREAALTSRLRHSNIIAVHEVATCTISTGEPIHYICMDYIDGLTLGRHLKKNRKDPLREKLILMEKIVRAIHYAHSKGVIHRDLKPENVLIDKTGEPIVMDFGLAKSTEGLARLTLSGAVMGTPMYMAPEQAGGKTSEITPRTDVYSLGVMMYEMITGGTLPFDGKTPAEIYKKILEEDPPHPKKLRENLHPDLGVICMKALEKRSENRYKSALAFAEDLQRFLSGEAIQARPPGLVTRIGRKAARRKQAVVVGAIGFVLVAAVLGFLVPRLFDAEETRLILLRERTNTLLDAMLELRRAGRTVGVEKYLTQVKEACNQVIGEYPNLAEPHYILGRMYRAVMNEKEALREQEIAVGLDPAFAPAQYERVVLEVQAYRAALREATGDSRRRELLDRIIQPGLRNRLQPEKIPPAILEKRETLERRLRALEELVGRDDHSLSKGRMACARGLLLWIKGDLFGARESLLQALELETTLEEGYEALATLEMDEEEYEESVRWWDRGIEIDAGYVPLREGRGFTYTRWARKLGKDQKDSRGKYRKAISDFNTVLTLKPSPETRLARGQVRSELAIAMYRTREEFGEMLRRAITDLDQVVAERPDWVEGWISRGLAWRATMYYLEKRERFDDVLGDLGMAIGLDPGRIDLRLLRGKFLLDSAQGYGIRVLDPERLFREALADFRRAADIDGKSEEAHYWKGFCLTHYGSFLGRQKGIVLWEEARDDFTRALALNPEWGTALIRRGGVVNHIAEYQAGRNIDPLETWKAAEDDFDRGIEREPENYVGPWLRGFTHKGRAMYLGKQGSDPRPGLRKAILDFKRAGELDPRMKKGLASQIRECEKRIEKAGK